MVDTPLRFDRDTTGDVDSYSLDFTLWLAAQPGDTIIACVVTVLPADMALVGVASIAAGVVSQVLSGGILGTDYAVSFQITTANGRQATRTVMLFCGTLATAPTGIVTTLAARALRKIGVAIVADANRPNAEPTQTPLDIADDMIRQMGIVIPEAMRSAPLATVSQGEIATRALRVVGVNPQSGPWSDSPAASTAAAVAAVALVQIGVTVPLASQPTVGATLTLTQIAARALAALGINPAPLTVDIGSNLPRSLADVATAALLKLAVIATDETASLTDNTYASDAAYAVHDILVANDFVTWPFDSIPRAAFEYYVIMVCNLIGSAFGKASSADGFAQAQNQIRIQALSGAAGQVIAEARVATVHDELLALGVVSWASAAVPAAEAEHYVAMTAILLRPVYRTLTAQDIATDRQVYNEAIAAVVHNALLRGVEARAVARVAFVHGELTALGFVTWNIDAIPAALVEPYAMLAASTMQAEGGKPLDAAAYAAQIARIRMIVLSGPLGQTLALAKVAAVHDEINALALASWSVVNIPAAVSEFYVELVANRLRPIYRPEAPEDRKADIESEGVIMGALKRMGFVAGAYQRAADRVAVVHAELNDIGLVSWPLTAIPVSASDCYMAMASSKMQAEGGIALTDKVYSEWVQRVRMIAMGGAAGQALAEQKVRAVHASLEARGRVRWTLFDVPSYAEEPYVFKAAVLLAPECGVKVDPTWDLQAERELMRIVSLPSAHEPIVAAYF